jgi:hypothetical protein
MIRLSFNISTISEIWILLFYLVFGYPSGKSIIPYLPCYQGLAVDETTASPLMPRIWGILGFRSIEVKI